MLKCFFCLKIVSKVGSFKVLIGYLKMADEDIVYSMTRIYNSKTGVLYVQDSRTRDEQVKNLYIGSSNIFTDIEETRVRLDVATDYLLASGGDRLFWAEILVDQINKSTQTLHIILDIGYELVEQHSTTAIVRFADLLSQFCNLKDHKLALASMTVVPELQHIQEKILEINKGFNTINLNHKLTPHFGVRSVMKFHKGSGSYKIRPSVWQEWKDNVGYGSTLTIEGVITYIRYHKGYFLRGFDGTEREGDLDTRVKEQNLQLQDLRAGDARTILSHKEKLKIRGSILLDNGNIEEEEAAYFQFLLSNIPDDLIKDGEEGEEKNRGSKRKRTE